MPGLSSNVTDTALLFEGGGMRASYTSGVVVALLEAGIHLDWVGGISAGSSNTANYLSRDVERARRSFTDFAADPKFGDVRTFVRGEGLFNARYIYQEAGLPGQALAFDWDTFDANPAAFRIGGFNATTGEQVHWGRADVADIHDLMIRVQASSTMPVLMPPGPTATGSSSRSSPASAAMSSPHRAASGSSAATSAGIPPSPRR